MRTIGRYELKEKLGEGGMGVVYRAHDPLLDRTIAVKLISASMEGNADLRERFFREARAAGQLSHRNIITIHDLGEHDGRPYLAMEYLEGEDLQRRLSRGSLMSLARKLEIASGICEGLEFAHGRGVVHRDIKPANVFITDNGTVKILDFGLARMVTSELTQSNTMMGTLNYMAPEQVRGERADHRSDIFSAGVMLYELLGGRKAFEADSVAATLYKILEVVPEPLQQLDSEIPPDIVAIVDRALAKSRDERYQNLADLLGDLQRARQLLDFRDASLPSGPGTAPTIALPRPPSRPTLSRPEGPDSSATARKPQSGAEAAFSEVSVHAETVLLTPAPSTLPASLPGPRAEGTPPPPSGGIAASSAPVRSRSPQFVMAAAAAVVLAGAFGVWRLSRPTPAATPPQAASTPVEAGSAPAPPSAAREQLAAQLAAATKSLEAGDYEEAQRQATDILARVPDDPQAQGIRNRAQETAGAVARGLQDARAHYGAERYDEAARAAGNVLTLSPGNADATKLMEDTAARTRGRGAADARTRMRQARAAASAANASSLAAAVYGAALAAEKEAGQLAAAGKTSDAAVKYYEASGLFRSAELGARNEADARRARAAESAVERPQTPNPAQEVALPGGDAPKPTGVDPRPAAPAPAVSAPPASSPPVTSPPRETVAQFSPEQAARELLGRYEAALEARALDALKRIWPGLQGAQQDAISQEFQHARRIQVDVRDPDISVSGSTATVSFTRLYELMTVEGRQLRSDSRTVMTLRRSGNEWLIQDIRFEPRR